MRRGFNAASVRQGHDGIAAPKKKAADPKVRRPFL
jgi:hypothetical protein